MLGFIIFLIILVIIPRLLDSYIIVSVIVEAEKEDLDQIKIDNYVVHYNAMMGIKDDPRVGEDFDDKGFFGEDKEDGQA